MEKKVQRNLIRNDLQVLRTIRIQAHHNQDKAKQTLQQKSCSMLEIENWNTLEQIGTIKRAKTNFRQSIIKKQLQPNSDKLFYSLAFWQKSLALIKQ